MDQEQSLMETLQTMRQQRITEHRAFIQELDKKIESLEESGAEAIVNDVKKFIATYIEE